MEISNLISLEKWTRLADVIPTINPNNFLSKSLYCIKDGFYLQISPFKGRDFIESDEAPFLTGLLCAPDAGAAKRVTSLAIEEDRGALLEMPLSIFSNDLIFHYGDIKQFLEKMQPKALQETAAYRIATDGCFVHRMIETESYTFYFRGAIDDIKEQPYAVLFKLRQSDGGC
jgi:hypothetical protein